MAKERKDKHFIKKPIYEGGLRAMRQFISSKLKYPKAALEEKIEGTVYLKYTINHLGKVISTKIISSLGFGCDEEAERIVRLLQFKVSKTRGIKVTFHKNIQIHFRLPKTKPASKPSTQQVEYHYITTNPSTSTKEKEKKKQSYSIQINY